MGNGGHAAHHRGDEETDQVGLRSGTGEAMVEAGNNLPQIHPPGHQPGESGVWCLGRQGDRDLIGSKRRRSTPDEDVGTQIGAVTPDHRSALSADFSKSLWVLEQIFEDSPAHERTDIPVDHGIIGEVETQTKPLEGLDCANPDESHESVSLLQGRDRSRQLAPACQPPVLPKGVAVQRSPFEDQGQRASRQLPSVHFQRVYDDQCLGPRILGVEVRCW